MYKIKIFIPVMWKLICEVFFKLIFTVITLS